MGEHRRVTVAKGPHTPIAWKFANAAGREDFTPTVGVPAILGNLTADDLDRLALQEDDGTLWVLTSVTPTWERVGGSTGLTATLPVDVTTVAAAVGVATDAARADHKHDVSTATPGAVAIGASAAEGSAVSLARSDHTHSVAGGTPVTLGVTNAGGSASTFSRSDHVHDHGAQTIGTLHAGATTSVAGFLSAPDKSKLDGLSSGAAALTGATPADVTKTAAAVGVATSAARADHKHDVTTATPAVNAAAVGNTAAEGTATSLARSDHQHTVTAAAPVTIGTANAAGAATTFVRSDHVHDHGAQTSGTLHATATISVAGFLSAPDKSKLDGVSTSAAALTGSPPVDVTKATAAVGVATNAARADHKHDITTATPAAGAVAVGNIAAEGTATSLALSDHQHTVIAATPVTIGIANAGGSATTFVRSDHVHDHGAQTIGTLHAAATVSVAGFLSAPDKTKLDGISTGAAPLTGSPPVDVTKATAAVGIGATAARSDHKHDVSTAVPVNVTKAASAEGTAASLARSDHKHDVSTASPGAVAIGDLAAEGTASSLARSDHTHLVAGGVPVTIGIANAAGAATTFARSDHVHDHGSQTSGTLHAVATAVGAGFMSAADKAMFDGVITSIKQPVRVATTANVTLSGVQTIDGVAVVATNRVLVKDQSTGSQNGIYVVAAGAWTRATDFDADAEVRSGLVIAISEGTANGDKLSLLTTNDPIILGTTSLAFTTNQGVTVTASPPTDVTKNVAVIGTATDAARADHKHDVSTSAPATAAVVAGSVAAEGTATSLARSDHVHSVVVVAPTTIGTINSIGSALTFVRSDHVHDHGAQTSGSLHAAATTLVAGFLSTTDKIRLDGMATGAAALASTAPGDVTKAAAAIGVGTTAARSDHKHDVSTAAAGAAAIGDLATEGIATTLARSDHSHSIAAGIPVAVGIANAAGVTTTFARSDHVHDHGAQTAATLHAAVTGAANGFMLAADKTKLDGIAAAAAALSSSTPLDISKVAAAVGVGTTAARSDHKHDVATAVTGAITAAASAAEGTATSLARSDHTHSVAVAVPVAIGAANAIGTAATFVRSDHVHDHGAQTSGTLHAGVTSSVNGFMLAADKTKLNAIPLYRRSYGAADLTSPVSTNWTVGVPAPLAADTLNAGLSVRRFDDTTQEGVSWAETIPVGATSLTINFKARAQTAPGATAAVLPVLYRRTIPDNAVLGAWSTGTNCIALVIPTNTNFQYDSQTLTLAGLALTAGTFVQFELTRLGANVSDTLSGDWALLELTVEYN